MHIELMPFPVPDVVFMVEQEWHGERVGQRPPVFSLREISPDILDALCKEFRDAVFAKAGITGCKEQ